MGYSYSSDGRLACDNCGDVGGVRRRKCPYTVLTDSSRGPRHTLNYCPPPALCSPCYRALGGLRGVHPDSRCGVGSRASQAAYDATQAKLDAGDAVAVAAWGDWSDGVPEGSVIFRDSDGNHWLVDRVAYEAGRFLSDFPDRELVPGRPDPR